MSDAGRHDIHNEAAPRAGGGDMKQPRSLDPSVPCRCDHQLRFHNVNAPHPCVYGTSLGECGCKAFVKKVKP